AGAPQRRGTERAGTHMARLGSDAGHDEAGRVRADSIASDGVGSGGRHVIPTHRHGIGRGITAGAAGREGEEGNCQPSGKGTVQCRMPVSFPVRLISSPHGLLLLVRAASMRCEAATRAGVSYARWRITVMLSSDYDARGQPDVPICCTPDTMVTC